MKEGENEVWLDLDGTKTIFLKGVFATEGVPIKEINFLRIRYKERQTRMAIPADLGLEPVPIRKYGSDAIFQKKKRTGGDKKVVYYFYGEFDLTKFLESDLETPVNPNANLTLCFKRQKEGPPISELFIYVA